MSNLSKKTHITLSNQGSLFDNGLADGALDVRMAFRDCLSKELSRSKLSRWQAAAEISRLSGREISKDMLDKCTSGNFDYGLRAEDLTAVICVLQTLNPVGCEAADPTESELVKLARLEQRNADLGAEIAALRAKLRIRK